MEAEGDGGEEEWDGGGVALFSRGEREDRVALTHFTNPH